VGIIRTDFKLNTVEQIRFFLVFMERNDLKVRGREIEVVKRLKEKK